MNSINLEPKTGIKAKVKFYNWAKKRGIDLKNFDPENINFEGKLLIRSFKQKAEEVKQKYNYKFANLNKQISNDLVEKHPNIETLIFERKK